MKTILKNSVTIVAVVLVISIMFAACGKSSSVAGTWTYSVNGTEIIGFSFTDDGKMTVKTAGVTTLECDYKVEDGKIVYSVGGVENKSDFTVDGNKLTISYLGTSYTLEKVK
ncbi:MAG: hypothetical protein E7614_05290 [Ruminococcaceae bacterium]|nr:hypothetical protein [Oscillospiraceae bacterium]